MSRVVSPRLAFLTFTLASVLGMAISIPTKSDSWLLTYLATGLVAGSPFGIRAAVGFALGFTAQLLVAPVGWFPSINSILEFSLTGAVGTAFFNPRLLTIFAVALSFGVARAVSLFFFQPISYVVACALAGAFLGAIIKWK